MPMKPLGVTHRLIRLHISFPGTACAIVVAFLVGPKPCIGAGAKHTTPQLQSSPARPGKGWVDIAR